MARPNFEQALGAWLAEYQDTPQDKIDRRVFMQARVIQTLSRAEPVGHETFAAVTGLPVEQTPPILKALAEQGVEFDDQDRLVGAALSLRETRHRFRVGGRDLFAWCALDTLFLPGLIGETATIESSCPSTGVPIRLTVTPCEVKEFTPAETALSIVLPGASCRRDRTGPKSDLCSRMDFYASRAAAERKLAHQPDLAILSLDEAFRIAQTHWVERKERAFEIHAQNDGAIR